MGRVVLIISFIIIVGAFTSFLSTRLPQSQKEQKRIQPTTTLPVPPHDVIINYTASFAIFTHGTFRIFTAAMYHNLSPDVFIQKDNPNVVHVEKTGITWDNFFKTLPFKLSHECLTTGTGQTFCEGEGGSFKFYLNGARDNELLTKTIKAGDQALISFGNENEAQIQQQLQKLDEISK